jgi:SAM-dependent methyltransferase
MIDQADQLRVTQDRGDRTRPERSHPRYWVLTLLLQKLKDTVDSEWLQAGEKLIDYGCGNKPYESLFRKKFNQYLGADLPGNPHCQLVIGPRGELPVEDESVDCVLSTQVLEHVENPSAYLAEANRVLRPGRALVLSTHGVWKYHPDPTDYWRWTIDGLQVELYRAGFDIWWMQSVFGMASCALQLWQDATAEGIPRVLRRPYVWLLQSVIGLIERRWSDEFSWDASVYVVLAKKRASADLIRSRQEREQEGSR